MFNVLKVWSNQWLELLPATSSGFDWSDVMLLVASRGQNQFCELSINNQYLD